MTLKIKISGDNAAFTDNPGEYARILRELAAKIDAGEYLTGEFLRDINGNKCGNYEFK